MTDEGLFEMAPTPVAVGDKVTIRTIYGSEDGMVTAVGLVDGYPMVTIRTPSGDHISVNCARVVSRA